MPDKHRPAARPRRAGTAPRGQSNTGRSRPPRPNSGTVASGGGGGRGTQHRGNSGGGSGSSGGANSVIILASAGIFGGAALVLLTALGYLIHGHLT